MTDLPVDRELDKRVARLVYGDPTSQPDWWGRHAIPTRAATDPNRYRLPRFSTDTAAALRLLDTLADRGYGWQITCTPDDPNGDTYDCWLYDDTAPWYGTGPTLPLATCACVLAALVREEGA